MTRFTLAEVRPFLKTSKSLHYDNGPYELRWFAHQDWAEILDQHNNVVGQVSGLEWLQRGSREVIPSPNRITK